MDLLDRIKHYEYLHIVFWLIKDSCWMLTLRMLGTFMIIPTIGLAILIVYHTRKSKDVCINLAILCWITANSLWMFVEFFNHLNYKYWASIPFGLGFLFVGVFYYKTLTKKNSASNGRP
jgi:hypothetical protein